MAALSGEPWRANCAVRVTNGSGTRHFRLSDPNLPTNSGGDGDAPVWEGNPGDELSGEFGGTIRFSWSSTNATLAPSQATVARIKAFRPATGTQIGSTQTVVISGSVGSQDIGFHFDADPFAGGGSAGRGAMIEWFIEVERDSGVDQWGPADSRGNFTNPGAGRSHDWARGYARARSTLVSHTLSNVSLGGAEPALFAYPDPIFIEVTLDAATYIVGNHAVDLLQSGSSVDGRGTPTAGPTIQWSFSGDSQAVDQKYAVGKVSLEVDLEDADVTFGGDETFVWAGSGHEAGWQANGDLITFVDRFDVDPTVTIEDVVLDDPASTVFNRGEGAGGTFEVRNARDETFTPRGTETVTVERVADGADEDAATVSRVSGVTSWDVTFGTSGNVAPADAAGDEKRLVWDDVASGVNTGKPTSSPVGFLSSLLDVTVHLQVNDNQLDPALSITERATDELGFYSCRITNQRGQGKDGVSVTDHLGDDQSLVAALDRTDTTATVNGNVGFLPLKAWDSSLPSGGWDHWTDAGTFEGNSFEKSRSGVGTSDYTLLPSTMAPVLDPVAFARHRIISFK